MIASWIKKALTPNNPHRLWRRYMLAISLIAISTIGAHTLSRNLVSLESQSARRIALTGEIHTYLAITLSIADNMSNNARENASQEKMLWLRNAFRDHLDKLNAARFELMGLEGEKIESFPE